MGERLLAESVGTADGLTAIEPAVLSRFIPFADFIETEGDPAAAMRLCRAGSVGRPLGDESFIAELEARTDLVLTPAGLSEFWTVVRGY